jgi:hypothetical protein
MDACAGSFGKSGQPAGYAPHKLRLGEPRGIRDVTAAVFFMMLECLRVRLERVSGDRVRLSFVNKRFARELDRWYGDP